MVGAASGAGAASETRSQHPDREAGGRGFGSAGSGHSQRRDHERNFQFAEETGVFMLQSNLNCGSCFRDGEAHADKLGDRQRDDFESGQSGLRREDPGVEWSGVQAAEGFGILRADAVEEADARAEFDLFDVRDAAGD